MDIPDGNGTHDGKGSHLDTAHFVHLQPAEGINAIYLPTTSPDFLGLRSSAGEDAVFLAQRAPADCRRVGDYDDVRRVGVG